QRRGNVHRVEHRARQSAPPDGKAGAGGRGCQSACRCFFERIGAEAAMRVVGWRFSVVAFAMFASCASARDPGTSSTPAAPWTAPASAVPPALPKDDVVTSGPLTLTRAVDIALA